MLPESKLPDQRELWQYYLTGLSRNIHASLAAIYGHSVKLSMTNRVRGERSDELLAHLLQHEQLPRVVERLLEPRFRTAKQGQVPLHDLALAHVLLCTAHRIESSAVVRSSSLVGSSMLLGSAVAPLRHGYQLIMHAMPTLAHQTSELEFQRALGPQWPIIEAAVWRSMHRENRCQHLHRVQHQLRSARSTVLLFATLADAGLDDRSFEAFLGHTRVDS